MPGSNPPLLARALTSHPSESRCLIKQQGNWSLSHRGQDDGCPALSTGPAHGKFSDVGYLARLQELEWTRAAMAWSGVKTDSSFTTFLLYCYLST